MCTLLWDYPAAACIFLFFTFPISFEPAAGPHFLNSMARGSRPETEIIGFAGRRARTGSRWI